MDFVLPKGVTVPSGLVIVTLPNDHKGIALKVPNVKGIVDETFAIDIPLINQPDDNEPNENFYLYDVDGNEEKAVLIDKIKSKRDIDFSMMEEE